MKKNQKGFSVVEVVLVLLVVGLVGGVGWYIYNRATTNKAPSTKTIQRNVVKKDLSYNLRGVAITFKDESSFDGGDIPLITSRIINPMVDYSKVVIKDDLNQITIKRNADTYGSDDYRYVLSQDYKSDEVDGLGFLFGQNKKIEFWQPQLCDDGGCSPYPALLKQKYPATYKAHLTCEAENKKINQDERSQEVVCI